jgi:hypothetical protein
MPGIRNQPAQNKVCRVRRTSLLGATCSTVLLAACAAPFSEMQSARLAGLNRVEVTPTYSTVAFSNDESTEKMQDQFGIHLATGIGDRTDMRLRYERISAGDGSDDFVVHVFGAGPKFALKPDRVALYVPVGFAAGDGISAWETVQIHPALLMTLPVNQSIELNGSLKALIPVTDREMDELVALNLGVGLGPDLSRWAIRPEVGFLFNPGEEGRFQHFSIGLTYYFDRR